MKNEQSPSRLVLAHMSPEWKYHAEPLGIILLKGQVLSQRPDAQVTIVDSQLEEQPQKLVEKIVSQRLAVLGLSLDPGGKAQSDLLLDTLIPFLASENRPLLIFGNVGATFSWEEILVRHPDAIIVRGEGENTMNGVLDYLAGLRELNTVPNLVFKHNGEIMQTAQENTDLSKLAPPYREESKRYINAGIQNVAETSRGCRYFCTFCNRHMFFSGLRTWRSFSIDYVINDLETLSSIGANGLTLADEDFLQGGIERAQVIAQRLISSKKEKRINPDFQISLALRVDDVYSDKDTAENNLLRQQTLSLLKQAGLVWLFVGVESGSPTQLIRYGKGISLEETRRTISIIKQLGIGMEAGFIMFDPFMNTQDIRNNIAFLKETGLYKYVVYPFSTLRAEPGSTNLNAIQKVHLVNGEYDSNWLEYPYYFQDERVEKIVKICHGWRKKTDGVVQTIKKLYKDKVYMEGVNTVEGQRLFYYAGLSRLIFLNLLEEVTNNIEFRLGNDHLNNVLTFFDKEIAMLANYVSKEIEYGVLIDRDGLSRSCQEFISNNL